jgi:hypothetical protein
MEGSSDWFETQVGENGTTSVRHGFTAVNPYFRRDFGQGGREGYDSFTELKLKGEECPESFPAKSLPSLTLSGPPPTNKEI